jgi:hypothetical protein
MNITHRGATARGFSLCAAFFAAVIGTAALADTQTLSLNPGWNLIALQVAPTNPAPSAVFGGLGAAFDRAFAYDASTGTWSTYAAAPAAGETATMPQLPPVKPGSAYWVHMNQAVPAWTVAGTNPLNTPPVNFSPGWNLIGVPVGAGTLPGQVNLLVFCR